MSVHRKSSVEVVENKLKEKYQNLIKIFEGRPYVSPFQVEGVEKDKEVLINSSELRMAIDEFSAILKEVRRYAK